MRPRKTLERILNGSRSIRFEDMRRLVEAFGFKFDRQSGGHTFSCIRESGSWSTCKKFEARQNLIR